MLLQLNLKAALDRETIRKIDFLFSMRNKRVTAVASLMGIETVKRASPQLRIDQLDINEILGLASQLKDRKFGRGDAQ